MATLPQQEGDKVEEEESSDPVEEEGAEGEELSQGVEM